MKNRIFILFIFLFWVKPAFCQEPQWKWAKSGGGISNDFAMSVTIDKQGNSYVTGCFDGDTLILENIILKSIGSRDIFIVKYDPEGNILWAKTGGGKKGDFPKSIKVDNWGNSYITGSFSSDTLHFDNLTLINRSVGWLDEDIFVVKYDTDGHLVWAKSAGGTTSDYGNSLAIDANGNLFVTGTFYSQVITFDNITLSNKTNSGVNSGSKADFFIVKYDSRGNVIWAKSEGGKYDDHGNSINTDKSGNLYITGTFSGDTLILGKSTLFNMGHIYNKNIFLVKYDSMGNTIWAKSLGDGEDEESYRIAIDIDGNCYLTGTFESPYIFFNKSILKNTGKKDILIVKYNTDGKEIWAQKAGGSEDDISESIAIDKDACIYITGNFRSPSFKIGNSTFLNPATINNLFVIKFDANGKAIWLKTADRSDNIDFGRDIAIDQNSKIIVIGEFESREITFGNTVLNNTNPIRETLDFFIAKLSGISNSSEPIDLNLLSIFPNPSSGSIKITSPEEIESIEITDMIGQVIYQSWPKEKYIQLEIDRDGIFILTLKTNRQIFTKKVIVKI